MSHEFKKINDTKSLYGKVEKAVKESILSGKFQTGEQLPGEIELSSQFGVSRPVIREAIKSLNSRGFLEIRRGKGGGSYVSDLSHLFFKENFADLIRLNRVKVDHLVNARLLLEPEVVKLSVMNAIDLDLYKIKNNLLESQMTEDIDKRVSLNGEFHKLIGRSCGNPLYSILMDSIMDFYEAYLRVIKPVTEVLTNVDDHPKIYNAIEKRDAEKAIMLTRRHIKSTIEKMIKLEKTYLKLVAEQST
ncbi:MAG: FadR family transcriptional regulator [Deltaproteobacteria bacterium]|nr:FadR family transcriptional regulator [Deltaproteobacteria bacterium]